MHIHILGICGTFMGSIAQLAARDGYKVSGSDENTYPPMSTQLEAAGITVRQGYEPAHLEPVPDLVVIGNALSRGNPAVEHVLNAGIPFTSGPRFLGENYLRRRKVIAVAGTHGKTTTSSMLAWIAESAGLNPGFLIGGVPLNFGVSARGGGDWFIVEADEYDTAFFDKRAKFVHYRPRIAILNNLEYDHADIYPDLAAIQKQFHHLVRTVPGRGAIIRQAQDPHLAEVLAMGCWSTEVGFGAEEGDEWRVELLQPDGGRLRFHRAGEAVGEVEWSHSGHHNALNACAAVAAACEAGIEAGDAVAALAGFRGVKRRMELLSETGGIFVYDDFAHHPTAIRMTLEGLRRKVGSQRILVALEPRSNTMRAGVHANELGPALIAADRVWLKTGDGIDWDPSVALAPLEGRSKVVTRTEQLLKAMVEHVREGDHVVFMSNGGFDGAQHRFCEALEDRASA